jgi:elongation factor Ts
MTTVAISAADVNNLRQKTGAGMMDCKKALIEANGDMEAAIDILRKKGQKIAANRQDREAKEGYVFGKVTADGKRGVAVAVCCETDFVAKNADFIQYGESILDAAMAANPATIDDLKNLKLGNITVAQSLLDQMGKIGEKIDVVDGVQSPGQQADGHDCFQRPGQRRVRQRRGHADCRHGSRGHRPRRRRRPDAGA